MDIEKALGKTLPNISEREYYEHRMKVKFANCEMSEIIEFTQICKREIAKGYFVDLNRKLVRGCIDAFNIKI